MILKKIIKIKYKNSQTLTFMINKFLNGDDREVEDNFTNCKILYIIKLI